MKKRMVTILVVMAFMLAITPTSPAFERHPKIMSAIAALAEAKADLRHASHDFGGHREAAIQAIEAAETQLHICLSY